MDIDDMDLDAMEIDAVEEENVVTVVTETFATFLGQLEKCEGALEQSKKLDPEGVIEVIDGQLKYKKIPGQMVKERDDQVANNAGGYVFSVSDETRIRRFIILGCTGGTFYTKEKEHTMDNAKALVDIIMKGKASLILSEIDAINRKNRNPKHNSMLFALALCARFHVMDQEKMTLEESKEERPPLLLKFAAYLQKMHSTAFRMLNDVCRTPTHLFEFVAYCEVVSKKTGIVKNSSGWGRAMRKAISYWYSKKAPDVLARYLTKYQKRNGWSHRDLFRLAHPTIPSSVRRNDVLIYEQLYHYVVKGVLKTRRRDLSFHDLSLQSTDRPYTDHQMDAERDSKALALIESFISLKNEKSAEKIIEQIHEHKLNREHVPTDSLNDAGVWGALFDVDMPMTAMIRNLGKMTSVGCLDDTERIRKVCSKLEDEALLKAARIHPITILLAKCVYEKGHGELGSLEWDPCLEIVDSLEAAFYKSFINAPVTGLRYCMALDVSGSMDSPIAGTMLTCREAALAMSLIHLKNEPHVECVAFSHNLVDLPFESSWNMTDCINIINRMQFGSTDCALPMLWAMNHEKEFDVFIIYTDSETYFGDVHPYKALKMYRETMGINAKLVVMGMTATEFTIADPKDRGMLDIVGFDSAVPQILHEFVTGSV